MPGAALARWHCPYCDAPLVPDAAEAPEIVYGLVRCRCAVYPVVEGILVLKPANEALQAAIQDGAYPTALRLAAYAYVPQNARTRVRKGVDFLTANRVPGHGRLAQAHAQRWGRAVTAAADTTFREAVRALRPRMYADYLVHRYANPSFLAAIGVLHTLETLDGPTPEVLDLACGTAHATFLMGRLYPHLALTATDHDFINLLLARWYLTPNATLVCCDHEAPLPFADAAFDAVFCLDAFHYIRSKRALVRELQRLARPEALWLFPHLHNAEAFNFTAGMPLSAEGYLACFDELNPRLFDEAELLAQAVQADAIDLKETPASEALHAAQAFTLVAAGRPAVWQSYPDQRARLHAPKDLLRLNPIYQETPGGGVAMKWPNAMLEEECGAVAAYLPAAHPLDGADGPTPEAPAFLWVPLPERY